MDGKKIMEGVPSKDKIEEALKAAMGEYPGISARSVEGMELRTQLKNYSISSEEQWPAEYL